MLGSYKVEKKGHLYDWRVGKRFYLLKFLMLQVNVLVFLL